MQVMAKKQPTPIPDSGTLPAGRSMQHALRFDDEQLLTAVDNYAAKNKRSRNNAILLLLEQVLRTLGEYPPVKKADA